MSLASQTPEGKDREDRQLYLRLQVSVRTLVSTFLDAALKVLQSGPVDAVCRLEDGCHLLGSRAHQLNREDTATVSTPVVT